MVHGKRSCFPFSQIQRESACLCLLMIYGIPHSQLPWQSSAIFLTTSSKLPSITTLETNSTGGIFEYVAIFGYTGWYLWLSNTMKTVGCASDSPMILISLWGASRFQTNSISRPWAAPQCFPRADYHTNILHKSLLSSFRSSLNTSLSLLYHTLKTISTV